jgi:hypothetical protein
LPKAFGHDAHELTARQDHCDLEEELDCQLQISHAALNLETETCPGNATERFRIRLNLDREKFDEAIIVAQDLKLV